MPPHLPKEESLSVRLLKKRLNLNNSIFLPDRMLIRLHFVRGIEDLDLSL